MLSALATARRIRVSLCSFFTSKASKASKFSTCYQRWPPLCVRAVNVLRVGWHLQVPHHLHALPLLLLLLLFIIVLRLAWHLQVLQVLRVVHDLHARYCLYASDRTCALSFIELNRA